MTFLPQYSQLMYVALEISQCQNRKQTIMARAFANSREQARLSQDYAEKKANGEECELTDDPYYVRLQADSDVYQYESDAIGELLKELEAMRDTLKQQVTSGVKSSCGQALSGGS